MSPFEFGAVIALAALATWCAALQVQMHQQRREQRTTKELAAQANAEASRAKLAAMETTRTNTRSGWSASAHQRSFPDLPLAQDDRPSGDGAPSTERPTTPDPSHAMPEADAERPTDPDRSSDGETALIIRDDIDRAFAAARAGDLEQLGPQQVVERLGQRTG